MLKILINYCHVYRKITKSRNELREFAQRVVADPYSRIVIAATKAQPGGFQAIFSCQNPRNFASREPTGSPVQRQEPISS